MTIHFCNWFWTDFMSMRDSMDSQKTRYENMIITKLGDTECFFPTRHGHSHMRVLTCPAYAMKQKPVTCTSHSYFASWVSYITSCAITRIEVARSLKCYTVSTFLYSRRRRQDSRRAVSCFVRDLGISN